MIAPAISPFWKKLYRRAYSQPPRSPQGEVNAPPEISRPPAPDLHLPTKASIVTATPTHGLASPALTRRSSETPAFVLYSLLRARNLSTLARNCLPESESLIELRSESIPRIIRAGTAPSNVEELTTA